MTTESHARKLAVILHADVVGSTALVRQDEGLAHERIQGAFRNFSETISGYGGSTREIRGDALVAEFSRASDALLAACAFQAQHIEQNANIENSMVVSVRVGIAMGEVIIADNTITGTGVVLAQRLEQLCEPDGIVVQGSVAESVPERLPFQFEDMGEQSLKGMGQPVRCFRASILPGEELPGMDSGVGTGAVESTAEQDYDPLSRPSIAVLPFDNMSGDEEQEYFSDGITEDIITELSRFRELLVIARNSSFTFKGKAVDVSEVGEQLGVEYVLEGSVRKAGNRVRITAQLIDVESGNHVWADRYDRELEDIFAVQDEVVRAISSTLMEKVGQAWRDRVRKKSTSDMVAYDWFVQGRELFYKSTPEENILAAEMFNNAISQDPGYATAYAFLGESCVRDWITFWQSSLESSYDMAEQHCQRALDLDDSDSYVHTAMGVVCLYLKQDYNQAGIHLRRARDLNPADTHASVFLSRYEAFVGNPEGALSVLEEARHNNPFWKYDWSMIVPYVVDRRYEDALKLIQSIQNPAPQMLAALAVIYARTGNAEIAHKLSQDYMEIARDKLDVAENENWKNFVLRRFPLKRQEDIDEFLEGLDMAGFPD